MVAEELQTNHQPFVFGVNCQFVDEPLEQTVREQCSEIFQAIEWHSRLIREDREAPKDRSVVFRINLVGNDSFEDPWTLYTYLAHDPESLPLCRPAIFTAMFKYVLLAVTSPQTCLDCCSKLIADMCQAGFTPSEEDWELVAKAYQQWGKLSDLPFILEEIRRLTTMEVAFTSLVDQPSERRQAGERDCLTRLRSCLHRVFLAEYTQQGHLFAVKALARNMRIHCVPDVMMFQSIIDAFVKLKDSDAAYRNYVDMLSQRIFPNRAVYKMILHGLSLRTQLLLDRKPYNTMVLADFILSQAMRQFADTGLFAATFQVYARHNQLDKAEQLLELMRDIGLRADKKIFLSLFYLNLKRNKLHQARRILDTLVRDVSRLPDPSDPLHHRFVLHSYIRCGYRWEALQHFWLTERKRVRLDQFTYSMLIARFARWRPRRALEVYERMITEGVEVNSRISDLMHEVLTELNMEEKAAELKRNSERLKAANVPWIVNCYRLMLE